MHWNGEAGPEDHDAARVLFDRGCNEPTDEVLRHRLAACELLRVACGGD